MTDARQDEIGEIYALIGPLGPHDADDDEFMLVAGGHYGGVMEVCHYIWQLRR